MVVAVAKAIEDGSTTIICASTGNTSASAAAYAARAGIRAVVLLPAGNVARGKLAQAAVAGATMMMLDCNFDGALAIARALARDYRIALVNSVNPHRRSPAKPPPHSSCATRSAIARRRRPSSRQWRNDGVFGRIRDLPQAQTNNACASVHRRTGSRLSTTGTRRTDRKPGDDSDGNQDR